MSRNSRARTRGWSLAAALILAATQLLAAIDGKWNFTWDTEGGVRQSILEFKQQGETIVASMEGGEVKGTLKGSEFQLAGKIHSAEAGYAADMEIKGKMEGDTLKGSGVWDTHPMTFTAVRAK